MKKITNESKGITLIALVITIIILLILAGVTLNAVLNNDGLINKTQKAVDTTKYKMAEEKVNITILSSYNEKGKLDFKTFEEEIQKTNGFEFFLDNNGNKVKKGDANYPTDFKVKFQLDGYPFEVDSKGKIVLGEIKEYNITYMLNGGTNHTENINTYIQGSTFILNKPTKKGYMFDGWYETSDFSSERIQTINNTRNQDITVYAKWLKVTDPTYFTWSEDKTTITGFSELGLSEYNNGNLLNLIFPEEYENVTVTKIGDKAFQNKSELIQIYIPDTITILGANSFRSCSAIEKITMPIGIDLFADKGSTSYAAFISCTGIKEVILTKGNNSVFNYTSSGAQYTPWYESRTNEMVITLEEGITEIGDYNFLNLTKATINIPSTATKIGERAFYNSIGKINYDFKNATEIEEYAFNGCTGISEKIDLTNLKDINKYIFNGCTGIKEVIISDEETKIGTSAFRGCSNIEKIRMPIGIDMFGDTTVTSAAFISCTGIKEVVLTKGNSSVFNYTSSGAQYTPWYESRTNEMVITLEEGITEIGDYNFLNLTKATINIPSTATKIGERAFYNTTGKINYDFKNATEIEEYAFYGCTGISEKIDLTNLKDINKYIFNGCTGIKEVIISDEETKIGTSAFRGCSNIEKITMPIGIDMFGDSTVTSAAFVSCTGIKEVVLTKGNNSVFNYSSSGAQYTPWYESRTNEMTITLEEGITQIGDYSFYNLTKAIINVPGSVTKIGERAFSSNTGKINYDFKNATEIEEYAFYGCTGISEKLDLRNLKDINNYVFYGCTRVKEVIISDEETVIGTSSFRGCNGIERITLPIGINMFGDGTVNSAAFISCTGIKEVVLTKGNNSVFNYSSSGTQYTPWYESRTNEMTITIEKGITKIGNYNFYNLTNATFYFTGTAEEWADIQIGENNNSLTTINYK